MDVVLENWVVFARAFGTTISLALLSTASAMLLGTLICAMRVSPVPPFRWVARAYVQIIRNTPLTVIFFMAVFGLPLVGLVWSFFNYAIFCLTIYTASFVAEAVRSGINAVPVAQSEAARSLGLTFVQGLRLVILPQALRNVIPPLGNVFIALVKNSSIAFAFGVFEATAATHTLANANASAVIPILLASALGYLILATIAAAFFEWLERRFLVLR